MQGLFLEGFAVVTAGLRGKTRPAVFALCTRAAARRVEPTAQRSELDAVLRNSSP